MSQVNFEIAKAYINQEVEGWSGASQPELARDSFKMLLDKGFFSPFKIVNTAEKISNVPEYFSLHRVARKVLGKDIGGGVQQIGDCVSWGAKHASEYTTVCNMFMRGAREVFKYIFAPYYYGTGRVYIGGGRLGNGDGSLGSWMAAAVQKYGTLFADAEGVPAYSGSIAKRWGDPRPADDLDKWVNTAKPYLVRTAAQIKSWDELKEAIANGYGLTVASNQGFEMNAGSDGYHDARGSWAHQMCHSKGHLIKGLPSKNIEDINVGDKVYNSKGQIDEVVAIHKNKYNGLTVNIKCFGNLLFEVTPDHPVLVLRKEDGVHEFHYEDMQHIGVNTKIKKNLALKWIKAKDVKVGDKLACPKINLPENENIIGWPEKLNFEKTKELAWFFGLYTADGGATPSHKICITVGIHQTKIINKCVKVIKDIGLTPTVKKFDKYVRIFAYNSKLANFMIDNFGKGKNKHLPSWLLTKEWDLKSILKGIYDGDGNEVKGRLYRIVNTSKILIDQIHTILINLGKIPKVSIRNHKQDYAKNWSTIYVIEWNKRQNTHRTKFSLDKEYIYSEVKTISYSCYDDYVYNMEVKNENSYIANGLVSHNCIFGYGPDYALIANSWGDVHGRLKDLHEGDDLPVGTIRARKSTIERMINAKETFAFSNANFFPAQPLEKKLFNPLGG